MHILAPHSIKSTRIVMDDGQEPHRLVLIGDNGRAFTTALEEFYVAERDGAMAMIHQRYYAPNTFPGDKDGYAKAVEDYQSRRRVQ